MWTVGGGIVEEVWSSRWRKKRAWFLGKGEVATAAAEKLSGLESQWLKDIHLLFWNISNRGILHSELVLTSMNMPQLSCLTVSCS